MPYPVVQDKGIFKSFYVFISGSFKDLEYGKGIKENSEWIYFYVEFVSLQFASHNIGKARTHGQKRGVMIYPQRRGVFRYRCSEFHKQKSLPGKGRL